MSTPIRLRLEALEARRVPSTFTVTNTADSGNGSLRQAILSADNDPGPNTIAFDIPGRGVHVIATAGMPTLTTTTTIDGTTQPHYRHHPLIQLTGPGDGTGTGFTFLQAAVTVRGLAIGGFHTGIHAILTDLVVQEDRIGTDARGNALPNDTGVFLEAMRNAATVTDSLISANGIGLDLWGANNMIQGNRIGTDPSGTRGLGNGTGVRLNENGNGGGLVADNLISGNGTGLDVEVGQVTVQNNLVGTAVTGTAALGNNVGIEVGGPQNQVRGNVVSGNHGDGMYVVAGHNLIQGNRIGTDSSGTMLLGNGGDGIRMVYLDGGSFNTIGGAAPGDGNVIADNGGDGILSTMSSTTIQGNLIGTDVSGTVPMGNARNGIALGSSRNLVGGVGAGNVISNNGGDGIIATFDSNTIQANFIGTDITGTMPMGNAGNGVHLTGLAIMDTVGGTGWGEGNVIAYSGRDGVLVDNGQARAAILGNSIHDSGNLGIELTNGANQDQPAPALTSATLTSSGTVIAGTLNAAPDTTFTLEFFANDSPDGSGNGEGQTWFGDALVTTDGSGKATFTVTVAAAMPDQIVTATATGPSGTSAFSAWIRITADFPRHKSDAD